MPGREERMRVPVEAIPDHEAAHGYAPTIPGLKDRVGFNRPRWWRDGWRRVNGRT